MEKIIIIRYCEIHLKGKNRNFFENLLEKNIRRALSSLDCLVEKAQSLEELKEVLNNNSISNYQKQIKGYKVLIKDRIKNNPNYGPITKKVFENIIDSDISPKEMVNKYVEYISTNDPRS